MPRVLGRVQTRPVCQFLYHARHVNAGQTASLYPPMAIDRAEQRPGADACLFRPILDIADRAGIRIRAIRNTDLAARADLIRFGPAKRDRQAVLAECAVAHVKPYQFRPAESTGEPEQD